MPNTVRELGNEHFESPGASLRLIRNVQRGLFRKRKEMIDLLRDRRMMGNPKVGALMMMIDQDIASEAPALLDTVASPIAADEQPDHRVAAIAKITLAVREQLLTGGQKKNITDEDIARATDNVLRDAAIPIEECIDTTGITAVVAQMLERGAFVEQTGDGVYRNLWDHGKV